MSGVPFIVPPLIVTVPLFVIVVAFIVPEVSVSCAPLSIVKDVMLFVASEISGQ